MESVNDIAFPPITGKCTFVRVKGTDILVKNYLDAIRIHVWFYEDGYYERSKKWFEIAMNMDDCPFKNQG